MSELQQLSPSHLWFFFDKFCQIPRPSKREAALSQWIQTGNVTGYRCQG